MWMCLTCANVFTTNPNLEGDNDPTAPPCTHETSYEYIVTQSTCMKEGSYMDVCSTCGQPVSEEKAIAINPDAHNWNKGTCLNGCGKTHNHTVWTNGVCDTCGYVCVHPTWTGNKCVVCGITCQHNWKDVKCTVCQTACVHAWENGICDICAVECTHEDVTEEVIKAATCKKEGEAKVTCNACGTVETKVLTVDEENGHDWIVFSFGGWFCKYCGKVTVDNPTDEPDPTPVLPEPSNPCPDDEHEWIVFSFGVWVCKKCGMMTIEDPTAVLKGDINGDGVVDGRDEVRLMRYLAGQGVSINEKAADLNDDGIIDGRDEIRLLKKLA